MMNHRSALYYYCWVCSSVNIKLYRHTIYIIYLFFFFLWRHVEQSIERFLCMMTARCTGVQHTGTTCTYNMIREDGEVCGWLSNHSLLVRL